MPIGLRKRPLVKMSNSGGFWNACLTDEELLRLFKGAHPTEIRPESLVAYWPRREDKMQQRVVQFWTDTPGDDLELLIDSVVPGTIETVTDIVTISVVHMGHGKFLVVAVVNTEGRDG